MNENIKTSETQNSPNINTSTVSSSSSNKNINQHISTSSPSPIINPELETIKKKPDKNKNEIQKTKIEIPKRNISNNNNLYNEDMENLIDISNEIEMITDELKETFYDDL